MLFVDWLWEIAPKHTSGTTGENHHYANELKYISPENKGEKRKKEARDTKVTDIPHTNRVRTF